MLPESKWVDSPVEMDDLDFVRAPFFKKIFFCHIGSLLLDAASFCCSECELRSVVARGLLAAVISLAAELRL